MTKTEALKAVFGDVRESLASWNGDDESIYSFYRWFVQDAAAAGKLNVKVASPAEDLRGALSSASRAAQQFGATKAQIDFIVSLAIKNNDFNVLSGGRLTKTDASHIIDAMKA